MGEPSATAKGVLMCQYHKVIKVLQLASGAKGKINVNAQDYNRYDKEKDRLPRLLSCYATAIQTG